MDDMGRMRRRGSEGADRPGGFNANPRGSSQLVDQGALPTGVILVLATNMAQAILHAQGSHLQSEEYDAH